MLHALTKYMMMFNEMIANGIDDRTKMLPRGEALNWCFMKYTKVAVESTKLDDPIFVTRSPSFYGK